MSRYHLYKREVPRSNGRPNTVWYYWYLGPDGRRVRSSTGESSKRGAEEYLAQLEAREEREYQESLRKRATFAEIAAPMFLVGAEHLDRWARKNRALKEQTVAQHRRLLDLYLIPAWGTTWCDEIKVAAFEDWLADLRSVSRKAGLSSSTKNAIARTFLLVMGEARRLELVERLPELEMDRRHSRKKDILFDDELARLFPEDEAELVRIWRAWNSRRVQQEEPEVALMFASLFALMVSAGLRPGEARALHLDQIYREKQGLVIDRSFDDRSELVAPKKSRVDDPRCRVTLVPSRTWSIVDRWLALKREAPEWPGLVFSYHGKPVSAYYLSDRLTYALENSQIAVGERNITPHSCRYTFDTKMKHVLQPEILREVIGHRSDRMTDHYDRMNLRPALESRLEQFTGQRVLVDRFWGGEE